MKITNGSNWKLWTVKFGSSTLHFYTIRSIHLWSLKSEAWIVLDLCRRHTDGQIGDYNYALPLGG